MIHLLLVLLVLVTLCVAIHGAGTLYHLHWMSRKLPALGGNPGLFTMFRVLVRTVYSLLLMHLLEILVWALWYQWQGCFPDLQTSFYYSATCYSTVGFGDVLPAEKWRIVGSIEAVTGVLMFGWSTGILFSLVNRFVSRLNGIPDQDGPAKGG